MVKRYSDQELQAFAQHYDTHGAVKLPGLLEPEVVERILEAMDKAAAHADDDMPTHAMSYGRAPGRMTIRYMWRVNPLIKKFLFQSDLVEAVARIVGSSQLRLWFDLTLIYDSGEPGVGGATSVIDYPDNNSRGKYIALMILTQGSVAGLFAGKIGMNIPGWLEAAQFSPAAANRSAFWFVAALAMLGVGFAWWGITYDRQRSGGRGRVERGGGAAGRIRQSRRGFPTRAGQSYVSRHSIRRLRSSQRFPDRGLVSVALGRGHRRQAGYRTRRGTRPGRRLFFLLSMATVVMPVLSGFIADRTPRMKFLMVALAFAAIAYSSTMLIADVFGAGAWIVVGLIGLSEGLIVVGAQSVLGEEAPAHLRGSSIVVFTLAGMFGVLLVSLVGGFEFDKIHPSAPFVLVGLLNLTALIFAMRSTDSPR